MKIKSKSKLHKIVFLLPNLIRSKPFYPKNSHHLQYKKDNTPISLFNKPLYEKKYSNKVESGAMMSAAKNSMGSNMKQLLGIESYLDYMGFNTCNSVLIHTLSDWHVRCLEIFVLACNRLYKSKPQLCFGYPMLWRQIYKPSCLKIK